MIKCFKSNQSAEEIDLLNEIAKKAKEAIEELIEVSGIKEGEILVVGCSSSEVVGALIGHGSSYETAEAIANAHKSGHNIFTAGWGRAGNIIRILGMDMSQMQMPPMGMGMPQMQMPPMGMGMPRTGRFHPVKAFTLTAMKSQYLKNTKISKP